MVRDNLDAVVNLIAAVNAGVVQAIARRSHEQINEKCPSFGTEHKWDRASELGRVTPWRAYVSSGIGRPPPVTIDWGRPRESVHWATGLPACIGAG